jgi:CubicO group peptidase (beta-lactamase class C family)
MKATNPVILVSLALAASTASAQAPAPPRADAQAQRHEAQLPATASDAVDAFIRAEMERRKIPGLSLAIIQGGEIVKAKGYGATTKGGDTPVTTATLFQAGSISKPVSALGALHLVERGALALDEDVNAKLVTWKVPENEFTRDKKVTLRGLLSHTAGMTVHGFPGYAVDQPVPTLVQVLNGATPANTQPIRVDVLPGSRWRYSGGGYTVMQQMVIDVTGKPFPRYMEGALLGPLGMKESTFEQPLPLETAKRTASGHLHDRKPVKGKWHIYPEMAAAGLWTTPSDLARFAVGVQRAAAGKAVQTVSRQMARQMLTSRKNAYGLGVGLEGSGPTLRFGHGGRDEGFDARLLAYAETGQGAVIMINANDNSEMTTRILGVIARTYHWPDYPTSTPARRSAAEVPDAALIACSGRYEVANNQMLAFAAERGRLVTLVDGLPDEEFLPEGGERFGSAQRDVRLTFVKNGDGAVSGILWNEGGRQRNVPRIGSLFHSLKPQPDPNPARTAKVVAALKAFGQGGNAVAASPVITPGARADLGRAPASDLAALRSLLFLAAQDVSSRAIERHEGAVSRILHYRLVTDSAPRCLLVHMTADDLITDYDIVDD